jgi:peptidyl-prolyl cis-trans isomerase D
MDIETFEKNIAEDIIINKYTDLLTAGMLITDKEVEDQYRKQNLTAKIDFVKFEGSKYSKTLQSTPEEVRAYYDSHKDEFQTGEQRKVQYLWISHDSEKNKVQIPETRLKEFYEQNKARFSRPDQVRVRHILLKTGEGKEDAAVLKQAQEIVQRLRGGADFGELAKQYSEDPGSKDNGGDLGFFERGRMVPEFENAAFTQQPNDIGDPVKTQYGYHIIQVISKQNAYQMDFALVKDQIYRELSQPEAVKNAEEQAKKLHEEITKNKKSMAEIAKIQLVELKTSDFFSVNQDMPGLGPSFRNEAFELKKGEISEPVRVFQDYAIIQLLDTRPSSVEPFEKVEAKATQKFKEFKASQMATGEAQFFRNAIEGEDFKAAAEKAKLTVKSSEEFTREGYITDIGSLPEINQKVFEMKPGEISQPLKANADVIVFQLKEKKEFTPEDFAKEKDNIRQQLVQTKQGTFLQGYRGMLRKKYEKEIWINEAALGLKET